MAVLTGIELIHKIKGKQLTAPSFDVVGGNYDILHAVCRKLADYQAVAFLASTPSSIKSYFGFSHFVKSIREISSEYNVSVAIHLDHAMDINDIDVALAAGCSSVMFDGSRLPLQKNIELTNEAAALARKTGASVEAELGVIGGKEDEVIAEIAKFPSLEDACFFCENTQVDLFAPAIGTAHGFYKGEPDIQWELIREIKENCNKPIVLHGATGLDDAILTRLLNIGFSKVNFATGVRSAFLTGIKGCLLNEDPQLKPQEYLKQGRQYVEDYIKKILDLVMIR